MKQYSIAAAKNSLPALIHSVEDGQPVELTRRGQPVAVLLSVEDYTRMSSQKPDLWAAIQKFRSETDLENLAVDEVFSDIRDRSPGREPALD